VTGAATDRSRGHVPPPESLARLLLDHPGADTDPLVCTVEAELSKAEFVGLAQDVAAELAEAGVGPDQAVAIQRSSGPAMAAGMFGAWLAGAVFVPVNARQPKREVDHIIEAIRPAAFLNDAGVQRIDARPGNAGPGGTQTDAPATRYEPGTAFVTWTSGTTGPPKPILQTHSGYREILGRVLSSIRKGAGSAPSTTSSPSSPRSPSPNLVPVSLALNAGIYNLLFGFMAGARVVLMERFVPRDFATLVRRYEVRSTVLPPAAMTMLTDAAAEDVTSLTPLRYVRSITAPLSPLAARRFMDRFGVIVLNGYGQAEIGEVIGWTAEDARKHPEKLGAAGRPHAGVDIKVVDEEGRPLDAGVTGQLLVRPPRMAAGYAGGDSLEDRVDEDGYVRTGDYATVDESGFVWIEGRTSDLIVRGGNKVFPDQVEEVLLLLPGIREAAVAGVPDARLGEVPVAFVVGEATDEELRDVCRENLVPYKIPVAFERVDEIPRSEVGKVQRRQLAESWNRPATS
jgi:acyl-CoA synthetase (AMP-forming)/AMP-acid ligase II